MFGFFVVVVTQMKLYLQPVRSQEIASTSVTPQVGGEWVSFIESQDEYSERESLSS